MGKSLPRIVIVTRKTLLELMLERHGTLAQTRFYLESRGKKLSDSLEAHQRFEQGLDTVIRSLPPEQRRTRVERSLLDRFLFGPDDVVVMVGQDGLVANTAKYLSGQRVVGVNPDPERYDGVLCAHAPSEVPHILEWMTADDLGHYRIQRRTMAEARREDGQRLLALNEVFVGHQSHQSARYRLEVRDKTERHSSSGLICATGTGCTGWARSMLEQRDLWDQRLAPEMDQLLWLVREPFPSVWTGTSLTMGHVQSEERLTVHSEMGTDGVVFADGIEQDRLEFIEGQTVTIGVAKETLNLVIPREKKKAKKKK